jgi:DNA-binding transcriptional MocR family regulator
MFELNLSRSRESGQTLVDQIVQTISDALEHGTYPAHASLPSVRSLAKSQGLSPYTVAEAYQRLVSMGLIVSRAGSGYRVADKEPDTPPAPTWRRPELNAAWLLSDVFADQSIPIKAGCGWVPTDWVNETGIQHALRTLSRVPGRRVGGYGHPYGLTGLREHVGAAMRRYALAVDESNVLLTQGATQAIDLIVRTLMRPGDTVLVEDPCYCNLLQILKLAALNIVTVTRVADGIDAAELEQTMVEHRPKAIFVNTVLQNPTGSSFSIPSAFRLLQIADRYGVWVVEDDISRELAPVGAPCLAAMEGLQRVVYVSGFSKTITPAVRVGYVLARRELLEQLALTKMAIGLTSSEITERAVANVLIEGHYERHVLALRERLKLAHINVVEAMQQAGLEVFNTPKAGLFLWAKLPIDAQDSVQVSNRALARGIWLAPGTYFRHDEAPSPWFRFNAATSDVPQLWEFIRGLA